MSSNVVNSVPYLNTTREFPPEMDQLVVEIDRGYVDTANAVNLRTIGLFPVNRPAITGEGWYLTQNQKQQSLRQVYTFTSFATINHGILNLLPTQPCRCWGSYTDGTNSYGITWGTTVAVAGIVMFYVTPTQIIFNVGAGAPAIAPNGQGRVVIEYLSQP